LSAVKLAQRINCLQTVQMDTRRRALDISRARIHETADKFRSRTMFKLRSRPPDHMSPGNFQSRVEYEHNSKATQQQGKSSERFVRQDPVIDLKDHHRQAKCQQVDCQRRKPNGTAERRWHNATLTLLTPEPHLLQDALLHDRWTIGLFLFHLGKIQFDLLSIPNW